MSIWNVRKGRGLGQYNLQLDAATLKQVHAMATRFNITTEDMIAAIFTYGMRETLVRYSCHLASRQRIDKHPKRTTDKVTPCTTNG